MISAALDDGPLTINIVKYMFNEFHTYRGKSCENENMACHSWLPPFSTHVNHAVAGVGSASLAKMLEAGFCHLVEGHETDLNLGMKQIWISSGFRAKSSLQPVVLVLAIYELCPCEPDQNVRMYCNSGHYDVGPLIHVVIFTWVEKAPAHVTHFWPY